MDEVQWKKITSSHIIRVEFFDIGFDDDYEKLI
jgi:hypothetical protein